MKKLAFLVVLILIISVLIFPAVRFKRSETLYAGGGLWAPPSSWNPITPWNAVTGTVGLIYETLYLYDPLKDEMVPWLVEKGEWEGPNVFKIVLRKGLTWSDGKPLTAEDVKFTFELSKKIPEIYYSPLWNWIDRIEMLDERTLVFKFSEARYHEWLYNLYQIPILPKHIWEKKSKDEILNGTNEGAIGSGAYLFETYDQDRMIYLRNENWWATKLLGLKPAPKRIVYLRVLSNNVALGMIMKGELDISNFFLPGVPNLKKYYDIHTWFKDPPYMLSDNTAFLFLNTTKKPMDDPKFRRALAFAIDVEKIVRTVFERQVLPSNPLGFLPIDSWMKYYDEKVVEKYGFKFDPETAKKLLDEAGYKDVDGDGYREAPDGSKIHLKIIVPYGWTDWMESIKIIADNFRKIGLNVEAKFPDFGKYWEDLTSGKFDMAINNFGSQLSSTPWTLYNWLFNPEISEYMYNGNFERYKNDELFDLIKKFNLTPMDKTDEAKSIISKIEEIFLKEMPAIPLWYNGLWFQASKSAWTNWPSEDNPYAYPCTWGGRWQMGGLMMLTKLKPAK